MKTRHVIGSILVLSLFAVSSGGSNGVSREVRDDKSLVTARAYSDREGSGASSARVRVTWSPLPNVPITNIIEYQILRDSSIVGITTRNQNVFEDTSQPTFNTVTYTVVSNEGSVITITDSLEPLSVGKTYRYRVRALYAVDTGVKNPFPDKVSIGGTGTGPPVHPTIIHFRDAELPGSYVATPLARPTVPTIEGNQDLSRLQVGFQTVAGADQYVFEFSTQPDFKNKAVRGPFSITHTPNATAASQILDIRNHFKRLPTGGQIYFRVGCRSSRDNPGPKPVYILNGDDYIYSNVPKSFTKQ